MYATYIKQRTSTSQPNLKTEAAWRYWTAGKRNEDPWQRKIRSVLRFDLTGAGRYTWETRCHLRQFESWYRPEFSSAHAALTQGCEHKEWVWGDVEQLIIKLGNKGSRAFIFTARPLSLGERTHGTHLTDGWVGPEAVMVTSENRRISWPCVDSNHVRPDHSQTLHTALSQLLNLILHLQYYPSTGYVSSYGTPSTHDFFWQRHTKTHLITVNLHVRRQR
jgi:hypothetical protein